MNSNAALAKLDKKVVLAEICRRGAKDAEAVEALIGTRLRLDGDGEIVAVDRDGRTLPGLGLSDVLDDYQRSSPGMFTTNAPAAKTPTPKVSNPFASGVGHSVTAQMLLWRTDPEQAEQLAVEAGLKINRKL